MDKDLSGLAQKLLIVVIFSATTMAASLSAVAGLKICNETNSSRSLAIAYSKQKVWTSEGWWNIKPGQCKTVVSGSLKQRYYYYRATTPKAKFSGGGFYFCTTKKPFTISGSKDCKEQGYERTDFRKIDTGKSSKNFKLTLTGGTKGKRQAVQEKSFAPGTHGEPATITGTFKGCRSQYGSTFCEIMTDEWVYVVPKDDRTAKSVYARLKATRKGTSVTLEGDITGYGDVSADMALRRFTRNSAPKRVNGDDLSLQGGWRSVDDKESAIRFDKGSYYSYYNGDLTGSGGYAFVKSCGGSVSGKALTITIKGDPEPYCYVLDSLDDRRLVLMYLPRGNFLTYERTGQ